MTDKQHISNIQALGYTTREARFLAAVALYSGYFVRRQYDAEIDANRGRRSLEFINKLIDQGHARRYIFEHNRQVLHLQHKPFYEAVGDQDSRNRREHQPQAIKARLMILDFVQAHPDTDFPSTGQQKAALFESRGVPKDVLPTKVYGANGTRSMRHFVDRFPIFTSPPGNGSPDRICFTYIDSGFETSCAFATHLGWYKQLFQAVGEFDLIFVGTSRSRFGEAENIFARVLSGDWRQSVTPNDLTRMLEYFRDWDLVQRQLSRSFSREKLDALRDARDEFSSPFHDGLFELWKQGGEAAVRAELGVRQVSQGRFVRYVLPFNYELFGDEEDFS